MGISRVMIATIIVLLATASNLAAAAAVVIDEATREASTATPTPNLRVGLITVKAGKQTAELIVVLHDGSHPSSDGTADFNITQLSVGDSGATEERASIPSGSWAEALRNFIKNPVLFTKMFIVIRKWFHQINQQPNKLLRVPQTCS
ncbi:unnamed protein product [Phytophthora lilii]|uniref:Unnamed protein product n=1 Tax=Phytophthora lilii TaxID=2077276 RepID=A0A9W6X8F5_9STRA|nr:unnamed protein product [Phytophthora lilii]